MSFVARLQRARSVLEQQGRLSIRALGRELAIEGEELEELVEELVDAQQVAHRDGKVLVWAGDAAPGIAPAARAARSPTTDTRKVISVIFADLMGSTALHERLDPESVNRVMDAYYDAVRTPVEAAGGTVVQLLGDGVLCAFGIPTIAEDDALRAVCAAVGIQRAFRQFLATQQWLDVPIGLRVAVNTGEVVVSEEHPAGIGDPLNVAARLQQEARDGEVIIGAATRRLVADAVTLEQAGVFSLKGRAESVAAYRVVSLDRPVAAAAAAFVGREDELHRLERVFEQARTKPAAQVAVLVGSPGQGKSRLIQEVGRRLGDSATVIAAHCNAAGGTTFAPIAEALRELSTQRAAARAETDGLDPVSVIADSLADDVPDRERIVAGIAALLAGSPASPEETFFVIRRLLTVIAQARPVVLVIDDMHWAEPLLLDLVEHLIQWGSGVPLFVLIGARPELRDLRSSLVTPGGFVADVVTLAGLDAGAAMRLAANVIGASDLPSAVAAKVLATSEGNPLFVRELVRMFVDEGAIERQGERWIVGANLAALEMPPTIHALLAARIERLRPEERAMLENAAVVGRHFTRGALSALLGPAYGEIDPCIEALRRTELIEPDVGWFLGEPLLRFHHVLIRDAAYRRLLKGTRVELHERLAEWIEAHGGGAAEHDETIGWHLEQAYQHVREIGPIDAAGRSLGERAARRLAAAGRRALERDDVPLAASLLGRAIELLDRGDPARADLALDWCEALLAGGDVATASKAIDELGRLLATDSTDNEARVRRLRCWHACFAGQLTVLTEPQGLHAAADAVASAAAELAALEDPSGEAKGHFVHALVLSRLGQVGSCEAALDRALAAARRAGDRRRANTVLAIAPLAALWGPSPVTRASGRCLDVVRVLRITQGAPAVEAVALSCQAVLEALRGRTEAARRMIVSARAMVEDLGITQRLLETDVFGGFLDLLEGNAAQAEQSLRGAFRGLRDLGLGIDAARAANLLGRALLAQDRAAEAEMLSRESESLSGDDLKAAIAWRGVRAEAMARRGQVDAAVKLAQEAVDLAAATDALLDHADARLALAAALRAAGRHRDADAQQQHAIELWDAKGASLLARKMTPWNPVGTTRSADDVESGGSRDARFLRRRPVQPNFATAETKRIEAAIAAGDVDALAAVYRSDVEITDHPHGVVYGADVVFERVRAVIEQSTDGAFVHEPWATLGDFVAVFRMRSTASASVVAGVPLGETEVVYLLVIEADDAGGARRIDIFGEDAVGDAVAVLYARYAALLPEGATRDRAEATARAVATWNGRIDPARIAASVSPHLVCVDRRSLNLWSANGADEFLAQWRGQLELATGSVRWNEVLALTPHLVLVRQTFFGTDRATDGYFEHPLIALMVFGDDGLLARVELWENEEEEAAWARFDAFAEGEDRGAGNDELVGGNAIQDATVPFEPPTQEPRDAGGDDGTAPPDWIENAAARADRELFERFNAREWAGVEALAAPDLVFDERRRMLRNTCGRDVWLAQFRVLYDVPASRFATTLLGTRGDRLSLSLHQFSGVVSGGGGPIEMDDHLVLHEVDESGRLTAIVLFDLGDAEEAWAELDARFAAREAARAPHVVRAIASARSTRDRDWTSWDAERAPGFAYHDHRQLGFGDIVGDADGLLRLIQQTFELAPDARYRYDHIRICAGGFLTHATLAGTRDGGRFENPMVLVFEVDNFGRHLRSDSYDVGDDGRALARFAEISDPGDQAKRGNAAAVAMDRWQEAFDREDWDALREIGVPGLRIDDRRRQALIVYGRDTAVEDWRRVREAGARPERRVVEIVGDRIVIEHFLWTGGAPEARYEVEFLWVVEVDEDGRVTAAVAFDADDPNAARREALRRSKVIEPSPAAGT